VFPFINKNLYVPDVPIDLARGLLESMNKYGEYYKGDTSKLWAEDHNRQAIEAIKELQTRRKLADDYLLAIKSREGDSKPTSYG